MSPPFNTIFPCLVLSSNLQIRCKGYSFSNGIKEMSVTHAFCCTWPLNCQSVYPPLPPPPPWLSVACSQCSGTGEDVRGLYRATESLSRPKQSFKTEQDLGQPASRMEGCGIQMKKEGKISRGDGWHARKHGAWLSAQAKAVQPRDEAWGCRILFWWLVD